MSAILKIELVVADDEQKYFHLIGQASWRWQNFGFGTFLCDVAIGEVDVTQEALNELLAQPERSGLQGMEFWSDHRLAWGSTALEHVVPCDEVNVPAGAKDWIRDRFNIAA